MTPRGKTPSLLGSGAGSSKIVLAKKKRTCKRCYGEILGGNNCIEVAVPGTMGYKTYCKDCFSNILVQTKNDIAKLSIPDDSRWGRLSEKQVPPLGLKPSVGITVERKREP